MNTNTSFERRGRKRTLEDEGSSPRKIYINIVGQDDMVSTYHVGVDIPMHKLLKKYCDYKKLEYLTMEFIDKEGKRVLKRRTPYELHMEDGDQIDAFVYSDGA